MSDPIVSKLQIFFYFSQLLSSSSTPLFSHFLLCLSVFLIPYPYQQPSYHFPFHLIPRLLRILRSFSFQQPYIFAFVEFFGYFQRESPPRALLFAPLFASLCLIFSRTAASIPFVASPTHCSSLTTRFSLVCACVCVRACIYNTRARSRRTASGEALGEEVASKATWGVALLSSISTHTPGYPGIEVSREIPIHRVSSCHLF